MAEDTPFDEICAPRHQEVSEVNDNFQLRRDHQNIDENNASKKSYLGTRQDRNGKWVRRHCSEKRYPRMAEKVNASSNNNEYSRHENKQPHGVKGRPSSSPRRRRQEQRRQQKRQQMQQQQQQQQEQLSSRQSDHSQHQPLHIERETRTAPEEVHSYIHNKKVAHESHITRSAHDVYKPIPPLRKPKPSQIKVPSQFKQESHVVEAPPTRRRQKQKHKLIFDVSTFQSNQNDRKAPTSFAGDEISGLFTTNSKLTWATRQSSLGSEIDINDEERIRRFDDAYNAIMLAHQANEVKPSEPRLSYFGKRWARDPKIVSALSIDGRSYIDLQRTPTLSLKQMNTTPDVYDSKKGMLNVELFDRKASWLVHMPRNHAKKSSHNERALFQVKEESTITEEEFSSPNRKQTTTENITPLTPCLRKLNDIETKIQAIEIRQKFDLEENRRAVVQAGLPPRKRLAGQRDGIGSASSVIRRFNQLIIDEESTTEEEQRAATISRSYEKNSTDNIETKIQAIETGQQFDLEGNRRAVVQADLQPRNRSMGQRDGAAASASSVNRRFNQFTTDEESTTEEEQRAATISRSYGKNSTDNFETKIQAIESGQQFDLEGNRRAIAQADLQPRNRSMGQRDGAAASASSVIRRFNQFTIDEESTTEEEQRAATISRSYGKNSTDNIETKIQAIETGQQLDLEGNRRAIAQADLQPRNRSKGQRDGAAASASSVNRRFNQFTIDDELTTEEEQGAATISRSYGKNSTDNIETKIQAIESGQQLDLEGNRRAIAQAGLPPRNRLNGQRDGASASSVNRRFNQLNNDDEFTMEEEEESIRISRSYDKTSTEAKTMDDYNSGIDNAPIVGTSTLRLLFSGKSDDKETNDSNGIINNTASYESKKSVPRSYLKRSFPTASNGDTRNYVEEGKIDIKNISTPEFHNDNTSPTSIDEKEMTQNLESAPDDQHNLLHTTTSTDYSINRVEEGQGHSDTNIPLRHDISAERPDPPDSAKQETYDASSYEQAELAPQLNVANIVRASLVVHARSFIDTDGNLDDFDEEEEQTMTRSMMMSPSLITKRYQQVLGAIEAKNWEQVSYLTHANPWLMEMKDVRNDQYLIHSLALFSGGQIDEDIPSDQLSIQEEIVLNILDYEPGVVHRLDTEGYLPLHMAAASGNIMMIKVLGERFPAAASVQNHEGLLPLHLAVMSCALYATGEHAVDLILNLFPAGVVVKENDGNTPLHTAAGALRGDIGVSIITRLLQVHEDILTLNPTFLKDSMGQPKIPKHFDEASVVTLDDAGDENCYLSMMKNNRGETPLIRAIKSRAGRQVVDVLLNADGGSLAALDENSSGATALHLILRHEYYDAAVAISILKAAPSTAAIRDSNRVLPIQLACANSLQREIILAIAIVDLPIDLGSKEDVILRNNFGASWWFLLCESNDEFADIVTEILSLCSHPQKMALCLTVAGSGNEETAVACATPLCKSALREGLRFLGRFEFTGGDSNNFASSRKVQQFDAIDYGPANNPFTREKKVSLICYGSNEVYLREAKHLQERKLELKFYEEFEHFAIGDVDDANIPSGAIHHCVAVIKSKLSLSRVVAGMPRDHEYRTDLNLLKKYFSKVKSIMFRVGQGIYKLHACDIIHGQIDSHSIMKFGDRWKITGLCGSAVKGVPFSMTRLGTHSPPEAFVRPQEEKPSISKSPAFVAEPSADIWAFGMLIYEAFVGESILASFVKHDDEDLQYRCVADWNNRQVKILAKNLSESGIGALGIDLICNCLRREPDARTRSMANILQHEFWKEKY